MPATRNGKNGIDRQLSSARGTSTFTLKSSRTKTVGQAAYGTRPPKGWHTAPTISMGGRMQKQSSCPLRGCTWLRSSRIVPARLSMFNGSIRPIRIQPTRTISRCAKCEHRRRATASSLLHRQPHLPARQTQRKQAAIRYSGGRQEDPGRRTGRGEVPLADWIDIGVLDRFCSCQVEHYIGILTPWQTGQESHTLRP